MSDVRMTWHPEAFKREVLRRVAENGEYVGQYVVSEARRRLNAIHDPDWGQGYRSQVARRLDYTIVTRPREVVITVGVKVWYTRWHGWYIEFGTSRRAAHPFLRPAVFDNRGRITALIRGE